MKTLVFMLLLLIVTSCAVTVEKDVTCWNHRICTGDTYVYRRAPRDGGGYYTTNVQVISIRTNTVLIRHANGREHWINPRDLDNNSSPIKVKHVNRGRGRGPKK